jgi:hypothetical protein
MDQYAWSACQSLLCFEEVNPHLVFLKCHDIIISLWKNYIYLDYCCRSKLIFFFCGYLWIFVVVVVGGGAERSCMQCGGLWGTSMCMYSLASMCGPSRSHIAWRCIGHLGTNFCTKTMHLQWFLHQISAVQPLWWWLYTRY